MATAQDLCDSALRKLHVTEAGEAPSADERAAALLALNLMVGVWNDALAKALAGSYASAIYTFVPLNAAYALADTVTVSAGWQKAMVFNLAVDVAPEYGATVPPEVAAVATSSKQAIFTLAAIPPI